jgi:superfamily II DNA or RNA helicase
LEHSKLVLHVDNNSTYVKGRMDSKIYEKFKKVLGYLPENAFWMLKNNSEKAQDNEKWKKDWDGYISAVCWNKAYCHCHVKKNGLHFHSGLLGKAVQFFKENNVPFQRIDIRTKTEKSDIYTMSDEFEFRDYQQEIIDKVVGTEQIKGIDRGVIKAATGSGKTSIAAGIIAGIGVSPTIFYVPSIDLLKQAKDEVERFVRKNGIPVSVGMIGGGQKDIKDITIMTIQTAVRALGGVWVKFDDEDNIKEDTDIDDIKEDIKNLIYNSKLMLADECQHWASETCQIISDASYSCQYKYALSATPFRDKGDDILIEGCFGRTIADVSASFLIKKGYLIKPTIHFNKISNMRGLRRTSYANVYKQAIVENEHRNSQIVQMANRFISADRKILILVKQISHGKLLEKLIPDSVFMYGGTAKKKRQKHLDKMRLGEPQVTIASVIFDEGIDVRPLDTLILAGSGKSSTRALQRIGRILRPYEGKKDAIAVDFIDNCKYMQSHSQKRLAIYKTEEEFEITGD